eukprot:3955373-Pyramimonas_sp.AAC.1
MLPYPQDPRRVWTPGGKVCASDSDGFDHLDRIGEEEGDLPGRGGLQGARPRAWQLGGPASELAYIPSPCL